MTRQAQVPDRYLKVVSRNAIRQTINFMAGWAMAADERECIYRMSLYYVKPEDSGNYTCITPKQESNTVSLKIKGTVPKYFCIYLPSLLQLHRETEFLYHVSSGYRAQGGVKGVGFLFFFCIDQNGCRRKNSPLDYVKFQINRSNNFTGVGTRRYRPIISYLT